MSFRGVLVGCGAIGSEYARDPKMKGINTHAGALTACAKTELVAVCDADPAKAKVCAESWKAKAHYSDYGQMLAVEKPEIVCIATPNHLHASQIRIALECPSVRGILAEKPLAANSQEAAELVGLARARGVKLAVNYSRRYSPGFVRCRELIRSGSLGEIQNVSGYYTKGLLHNGTHWIDLARWFFGDVTAVSGSHRRNESSGAGYVDAQVDATLSFENGTRGTLVGLDADAFSLFEMDVVGTAGRIEIRDSGNTIRLSLAADSPFYSGYKTLVPKETFSGEMDSALSYAMENLVATIEGETSLVCSAADGFASLSVAERALGR